MSNTELKNCPFCGNAGIVHQEKSNGIIWAGCSDSDCIGHRAAYDFVDEEKAIEAWNTRVPSKAVASQEPVAWLRYKNGHIDWQEDCLHTENDLCDYECEDGYEMRPLFTTPPANKDSERLAFVLANGMPTEWNTPDGLEYGYGHFPSALFTSQIQAIDAAMKEGK